MKRCRKESMIALVKRIIYILLLFLSITASSQNLIVNGSFEDTIQCPNNQGQIYFATGWQNPNLASPDLFHSCFFYLPSVQPRTGNSYAGIFTLNDPPYNNHREYIQNELSDTLKAGKEYCLSFYVNLPEGIEVGCNSIGAYFSNNPVSSNNSFVFLYTPQIENPASNPLNEPGKWILVYGTFVASGDEKYLTIGNFKNDINSDTVHIVNTTNSSISYYAIDDVSLVEECDKNFEMAIPNVFTPNGDGINDLFLIESTGIESVYCEIFDRWGIKVASISRVNEGWDGRTTSGQEAIEGVYYYIINARNEKGENIIKKGFVQLLR